jgi:hypothetical protein
MNLTANNSYLKFKIIHIHIYIYIRYSDIQGARGGATSRNVAGSIPDGVIGIFNFHFISCWTGQWIKADKNASHLLGYSTRRFVASVDIFTEFAGHHVGHILKRQDY